MAEVVSRGPGEGGNKFKLVGVVVHDAPFSPHLPFLGRVHIGYDL